MAGVTLKLATSLDGRIAMASGESRWITGEAARAAVQVMRAAADAVMVGAGTVRADDPSLLARGEPAPPRQPARVVASATLELPLAGRLFQRIDESPLYVLTCAGADAARAAALERAGARIVYAASAGDGIDWTEGLRRLSDIGLARILAEGGGGLAGALLAAGAVGRIEWFRAPILLGAEGRPCVGPLRLKALVDALSWRRVALRELGPDLWESYERA